MNLSLTPEFLTSILLSLLLGSIVGIERQWHRRLVDLKTNALVALGAALFMLICRVPDGLQEPIRMAAQIVVGVGFLGGGILFRDGVQTRGLNTAATLWCSAAVGALCGMGRWNDAMAAAITIVLANTLLRRLAQFLNLKMGVNDQLTESVTYEWVCALADVARLQAAVQDFFDSGRREVRGVRQEAAGPGQVRLTVTVLFEHDDFRAVSRELALHVAHVPVAHASWHQQ